MTIKSVQSIHPCKSVIQTFYDIVKAHGGELSVRTPLEKVETNNGGGAEFIVQIPHVNT